MFFPDNFKKVVDLLISKGADLEALDSQIKHHCRQHLTSKTSQTNSEIAYHYLLEKGANQCENFFCMTPSQYYQTFTNLKFVSEQLSRFQA